MRKSSTWRASMAESGCMAVTPLVQLGCLAMIARGEPLPLASAGSLSTQPPGSGGSIQDAALDEGDLARITVRLPEGIKDRAEEQAGRLGQSLNSWIVKTLRQATGPTGIQLDLSGDRSFAEQDFPHGGSRGRLSGWI